MFKRSFVAVIAISALTASIVSPAAFAHEGREVGEYQVVAGFLNEPAFEGQVNAATIRITRMAEDHSQTGGPDLEGHGAIFASGPVEPGNSFEFEFGEDLEGLVVPFHDHLSGSGGTVAVSHDAESGGTVMVRFTHDGFSPSELALQPGTTVMFMNMTGDEVMTVLSGPHDSAVPGDGNSSVPVTGAADTLEVEVTHISTGTSRTMELRPVSGDDGLYAADFVPTAPGAYTFRFFGEIEGEPFDESFTSGPGTFAEVEAARNVQFPIGLREPRELQNAVEGMQSEIVLAADTAEDAGRMASLALVIGITGLVAGVTGIGAGAYSLVAARRKG